MITQRFSGTKPVSCTQGRHGELIVVQGGGVRPARWDGTESAVDAGMDAPTVAPTVTLDSTKRYYVARTDVKTPGAVYYSAPDVSFSGTPVAPGGRPAVASAYLSQAALSEILVTDGGKHYPEPPAVSLSDTHGKGAVITAILDAPGSSGGNDPFTGITQWTVTEEPDGVRGGGDQPRFACSRPVEIPISGNGTFTIQGTWGSEWVAVRDGYDLGQSLASFPTRRWTQTLRYTVSGWQGGSGAKLRLVMQGGVWIATVTGPTGLSTVALQGHTGVYEVLPASTGSGYSDSTIRVTLESCQGPAARIVIEGYTAGNSLNTTSRRYPVQSLRIDNRGSGYVVAPQIKFTSNSGFGAYATATVKSGRIDTVTLENGGGGYKTPPKVIAVAGGAEAFAVARPHLRGKYQCYYRYIDSTPEGKGGPIPSSLSPLTEIDAGEGAASLTWSAAAPSGRATQVELWRSTGNQATTLYRVHTGSGSFVDDLTDDEVRNPDRPGYAAMPIVLPNGELNANRFTPPPSDKAVVVRFQDRYWYGVDTSGKQPNTVLYSEVDEPESVPDINEIILQQNAGDSDSIKALVPFGSSLLVMQSRHAYSLTFAKNPALDADVSMVAYRGAINQRCWDIYAGTCYVLDQYGVYAINSGGQVEQLSDAIDNLFRERIDWGRSTWNFVRVDPTTKVLRAFVAFTEDSSKGHPTRALCLSLATKAWWIEMYPHRITAGTPLRLSNGDYRCVYGAEGGVFLLDDGRSDLARGSVISAAVTSGGRGYTKPPVVRAAGGSGAHFQASVDGNGRVQAIWVLSPGYGYASGQLYISPPDTPGGVQATASFTASPLSGNTPLAPTYRFKGACVEYPSDAENPQAAAASSRNVRLLYKPQRAGCRATMRLYYNHSPHPRRNVVGRNRGVGFVADEVISGFTLDMGRNSEQYGDDTGVASAMLAGRTIDDVASSDRYMAVELTGARTQDEPVVFYKMDIMGSGK